MVTHINTNDVLEVVQCPDCAIRFAAPARFLNERRKDARAFHCPNGHKQGWWKSEADKVREEKAALEARLEAQRKELERSRENAQKVTDQRDHARRRVSAAKGQITKIKNRVAAGICPCCTRHFENLQRHMASQHPNFQKEPDAADLVKATEGAR